MLQLLPEAFMSHYNPFPRQKAFNNLRAVLSINRAPIEVIATVSALRYILALYHRLLQLIRRRRCLWQTGKTSIACLR